MGFAEKATALLLAIFFSGGIFLCVGIASSMHHEMSGGAPCPMTSTDSSCSTPTDHISYWGKLLSAIPSDFAALIVALAIACACVWLVCRGVWNPISLLQVLQQSTSPPTTFFLPRHALQEAFSNGILHPKLY